MSQPEGRISRWFSRARATPARVERLDAGHDIVADELADLHHRLADLDHRLARLEDRPGIGPAETDAIGAQLHELRAVVDDRARAVDRTIAGYVGVLGRIVTDATRRQVLDQLIDELGPSPELRPGLSAFTVTWHHAGFLEGAVRSALAALDRLPYALQGEALVLDDGSLDETVDVTAQLTALDQRVRVIRAPANIGVGHARNALLHAVTTTHAFQLDADNLAVPDGVAALFNVATTYGAASVYGNILKFSPDGDPLGVMSNEPITPAFFTSNYIDTMAVVDVATLRSIGGWPTDPMIEHLDDWVATHALLRRGHLVGFVPVVTGRYRELEGSLHTTGRVGPDPIRRMWDNDGRLTADRVAAFAAHPAIGPLWATESARRLQPKLDPAAEPEPDPPPRVLVVASGGVRNVGDDAITVAVIDRIRHAMPAATIEVVTDQDQPIGLRGALWRGTLIEALTGETAAVPGLAGYAAAVFAGGGSITSRWRSGLIEPRVLLARRLTEIGVPYVMSGQGLGPLDHDPADAGRRGGDRVDADLTDDDLADDDLADDDDDGLIDADLAADEVGDHDGHDAEDRQLVAELIGGARRVAVRDPLSAALCREIGVPDGVVTVTGDDALGLEPVGHATLAAALAEVGVGERPYLAVTVREADYVGDHDLELWADAVDRFAAAHDLVVLGVALNDTEPFPEAVTLARLAHGPVRRQAPWHLLSCERDPRLLAATMANAEAAAVHSYHAALLALTGNCPAVLAAGTAYYRDKALGLAALAGLPDDLAVEIDTATDGPLDLEGRLVRIADAIRAGAGLTPATKAVDAWWTDTGTFLAEQAQAVRTRS